MNMSLLGINASQCGSTDITNCLESRLAGTCFETFIVSTQQKNGRKSEILYTSFFSEGSVFLNMHKNMSPLCLV